jgi:cytochrome d ubiquinol oxidase subunit II
MVVEHLQTACYFLIFFLFAGFTVLDGFDLGVGMLVPFYFAHEERTGVLFRTIWPVWDGNELWGFGAVLVLYTAFPPVFARALSAYYPLAVSAAVCLAARPVLFELRFHDRARRKLWEITFAAGSVLLALLFGMAFASSLGVKTVPAGPASGFGPALAGFFDPLAALGGALWVVVMALHGASYLVLKTDGEVRDQALALGRRLLPAAAAGQAGFMVVVFIVVDGVAARFGAWLGAAVTAASLVLAARSVFRRGRTGPILWSSLSLAGLWIFFVSALFPYWVRTTDPALAATMYNASSAGLTLRILIACTVVALVPVILYTAFVYRQFKGRVGSDDGY